MVPRAFLVFLAMLVVGAGQSPANTDFPRPPALDPQVRFWTRIYSEVDGNGGFIHDSVHLDVVYETLRLPEGLSTRSRERLIERTKDGYVSALKQLASGKRSGLTDEQARVLALWPEGVSNATLRDATRRVRFQLGQADRFREGLQRASRWSDHIRQVLEKHGVPLELVALPHVESSFNPTAYSRVGAAGLWQFTYSTGRLFLRIDSVVDERMDPFAASEGAARLLRSNYDILKSWPLAITAYNHGVWGMKRAVKKLGTDDIAEIIMNYSSRTFGFASRNFYAEFLAASDVSRYAEHYFDPVDRDPPVAYEIATVDDFLPVEALTRVLGVEASLLREHNASLRPSVWNGAKYIPRGFSLRVPADALTTALETALASIPVGQRFAAQHRDRLYKVQRGDTLSKIASRYHVKERDLVALNNLRSRHIIRAGQVLTLPDAPGARARVSVARAEPPADGIYHVRRGDTLSAIAARFGLSESKLVALNGLRNRNLISTGQKLQVVQHARTSKPSEPSTKPSTPTTVAARSTESKRSEPSPPAAIGAEPTAPTGVAALETERAIVETAMAEAVGSDPFENLAILGEAGTDYAPVIPAANPADYAVTADGRITVQAAETLGHYANWLEIPTHRLRELNAMRYTTPVVIGRQTRLDFSRVSPEAFEQRRLEYHHAIQEEFFNAYQVIGTDTHVLSRGDTLWELAERRYRVPVWLLHQYNPTLDFGALQVGSRLTIPKVSPRES